MLFLSSLDNLLQHTHIIFQKGDNNFEVDHKTYKFLDRVQYPLKILRKLNNIFG